MPPLIVKAEAATSGLFSLRFYKLETIDLFVGRVKQIATVTSE